MLGVGNEQRWTTNSGGFCEHDNKPQDSRNVGNFLKSSYQFFIKHLQHGLPAKPDI
jgi:hypothetical protein